MWPLVPVFSEQAERGAPLAFLVIILCERCNRSSPCHTHKRDCSIRRVWKKHRVSKANKDVVSRHLALGTMGIYTRRNAIWRIFVLLITFSSYDLSSRLLKMEQKSTIATFFPQISTKWFPLSSLATKNFKFRVWFVKKKKLLSVLDRIPFFYIKWLSSTNCHDKNLSN